MLAPMKDAAADALTELEREIDAPGAGLDRLRLMPTPFVPEVRLHLAEDAIVWWARMEAAAGHALPAPYWASAWAGGQALARHLLDHPELAAGRRVLDLAAGSGLVAIAAALAGAAEVIANDIDPYAVAAVTLNARANHVAVDATGDDLLDSTEAKVDLVRRRRRLLRPRDGRADAALPAAGRRRRRRRAGRRPRPRTPTDGPPDRAGRLSGTHHRTVGGLVATPGAGAAPRLRRTPTQGRPRGGYQGSLGATTRCPKWCRGHSVDA